MQELTRSTIAKLLATENITVVQDKVRTASFDVKNRVLTLPIWASVDTFTEDHLIGHEVGHALYTPLDGWHEAVCEHGPAYKSYLNVVEDARIEKLIQRKYPGLRASFIRSYRKMMADEFFGGTIEDINRMSLIDRINVYFKCGQSAGVKFDTEESQWLPRIDALETWDQVVELVDELYAGEKQKQIEMAENAEDGDADYIEEDDDDTESSSGDFGGDEDDYTGEQMDGDTEDDGDGDDETEFGEGDITPESETITNEREIDDTLPTDPQDPMVSRTDRNLREQIADNLTETPDGDVTHFILKNTNQWERHIKTFKQILTETDQQMIDWYGEDGWIIPEMKRVAPQLYAEWQKVNKKAVNHMVKEFEMRKSASEYARALTSKTGVIDTVKMNRYKLTDDIFKKVTVVPEGKNHGFIMYLDMSGSMGDYMYETVEQLLTLVHFAKQIQVPFRVYGFTNNSHAKNNFGDEQWGRDGDLNWSGYNGVAYVENGVTLLELFSDKMNRKEMTTMSQNLLWSYFGRMNRKKLRNFCNRTGLPFPRNSFCVPMFQLGGTPLDHALVIGMNIGVEFRKAHRIDVLNTIILSDGVSHNLESRGENHMASYGLRQTYGKMGLTTITCPFNNKTYKYRKHQGRNSLCTDILLEMYKDVTGSNIIGYFIERGTQSAFENSYTLMTGRFASVSYDDKEKLKKYRKDGWFKCERPVGYDECYIICDKSLQIHDSTMDGLLPDASKARIKSAFSKSMTGSKASRKMLSDLVAMVA